MRREIRVVISEYSITVDAKLYLERWLLSIKVAAGAAGLEAHVRALDFKGGQRLAFEVRKGNDSLEIRYRKRRTGPHMVAAATSAEIVGRVREVHRQELAKHRKLLENGLRRFLRRSVRLLESLESALYRDGEFLQRTSINLREIPEAAGALPAALVRRRRSARGRYEILPAAALRYATSIRLVGVRERRLVDLDEFLPKRRASKPTRQVPPPSRTSQSPTHEGITPLDAGTELLLVAADVADSVMTRRADAASIAADQAAMTSDLVAEGVLPEVCADITSIGDAGGIVPEAVAAAGVAGAESAGVAEAAVEVVSSAGSAAEALAETGSAFSDAACAGVDCGGLDCIPL